MKGTISIFISTHTKVSLVIDGKTVTIKGNDGSTYVEGDSSYTITVDAYEETVDLSGASDTTTWEDYQVEKPEELK